MNSDSIKYFHEQLKELPSSCQQDVLLVLKIKQLLYERKYTIEGARQYLKKKPGASVKPVAALPGIPEIRDELISIRDLIDSRKR